MLQRAIFLQPTFSMKRLLTMAAYTSTVTKLARSVDVPDDVDRKSHHVKSKTGETIRFRNPHPSAGPEQLSGLQMGLKMGRYAQFIP